jgi:hypothetical protein
VPKYIAWRHRRQVRLLQAGPPDLFLLWAQKFLTPTLKVIFRITANFAYKRKPTCVVTCAPCSCGNSRVLRVLFRPICCHYERICWCTGSYIFENWCALNDDCPLCSYRQHELLMLAVILNGCCISFLNYPKKTRQLGESFFARGWRPSSGHWEGIWGHCGGKSYRNDQQDAAL